MRQSGVQLVLIRSAAATRTALLRPLLTALALLLAPVALAESEPVLEAAELVDASLLSGPGWRVEPRVPVSGYQARFRVHTDWGEFEADSVELLALRVAEMPALEALHRASVSQVLMESAADRFGEPVQAVDAIADDPERAAAGLPDGVARYFSQRWEHLRSRSRKLADRGHRLLMEDGSAYDNPSGPMGAAGLAQQGNRRGWWERRGRELGKLAKQEVGYPAARSALAQRLAVDPHTRHPLIAPRLDALAWAETSGRFATGEVLGLVGGPAGELLAGAVQVNELVLTVPPEALRARNQALLADHCLDERLLRAFVADRAYTPGLQTELVDLYVAMAPAQGCEALLETALMAEDEAQARFVVNGLKLMASALGDEARGGAFVPQGALLAYRTPGGEFVLPLAVDWLAWTPDIQAWFDLPSVGRQPRRTVLVGGNLSPTAQAELTERGWSLVARQPYPGSPPYLRPFPLASADAGKGAQ